jgi:chromate reductase
MRLLAISGSLRRASTNTALLRGLAAMAAPLAQVTVFEGLGDLPIFNPDNEGDATPDTVRAFAEAVAVADGIVISCPEYVHALPGGFKNALDWIVSRSEIIGKPIALLHASHRGEDVLADLRRVLSTVSDGFAPEIFACFPMRKMTPNRTRPVKPLAPIPPASSGAEARPSAHTGGKAPSARGQGPRPSAHSRPDRERLADLQAKEEGARPRPAARRSSEGRAADGPSPSRHDRQAARLAPAAAGAPAPNRTRTRIDDQRQDGKPDGHMRHKAAPCRHPQRSPSPLPAAFAGEPGDGDQDGDQPVQGNLDARISGVVFMTTSVDEQAYYASA